MTHDGTTAVEFPATSAAEKRGVFASKDLLGERFEVICHTKKCGWAGDWEDTYASRVEAGNVVECAPNLPDAELCCPKCLLTNLVETDGWDDDQLPRRAFRPPNAADQATEGAAQRSDEAKKPSKND